MRIRPIKVSDNQAIKHILQTDLEEAGLNIPGTAYFDKNLDTLSQFYDANDKRAYFVAEDDQGQIVGGAGCAEFDAKKGIAELQKLYLAASARGHHLSFKLIDQVEKFAKEAGYKQLYLETHHNLKAAVHIYPEVGFQRLDGPIEPSMHSGSMDGFYIKSI